MNFLEIFNIIARAAKPMHMDLAFAQSFEDKLEDIGIDSLDGLMMMLYIGELYGIPDEAAKDFHPTCVQEVYDFIQAQKTKEPQSIDEVKESVK